MKFSKILIAALLAVMMLTVAAFANDDLAMSFDLVQNEDEIYEFQANVQSGSGILTYLLEFSFNNEKLNLINVEKLEVLDAADYVDDPYLCVEVPNYGTARRPKYYGEAKPARISVDGNKTTIRVQLYATPEDAANFPFDDINMITVYFDYAAGVTNDDLVADDFKINEIVCKNGTSTYGYNNDEVDTALTVSYKDAETAGDAVISFVSGKPGPIPPIILPINESGVDLRVSGNEATSGIRFKADFQTAYRVEGNELGYIASVDKEKNYTDGALVLDFAAVDAGKAAKGIAYGEGKDIFWNVDGETTVITVALLGTPMTKEALQTGVAVRAYQIIDGTTYYANDAMRSTPYDTAKAIKAAGGEAYTKNQEYVDKIIATVEDQNADPTAIVLDISSLFE